MKISYSWLSDYVTVNEPVERIGEILTSIGLEVESIEKIEAVKGGLEGVVVGKVLTCTKHPEADRLSVTTVDVGTGEPLQIVCGAPNVAPGQKVPVATVGATLYFASGEEVKIKRSKLRGVESMGMICAEDELGIGTSHDGIMVLPTDLPVGTPMSDYLKLENDYLIEIGLTANHIDAASHVGVARDLAAYLRTHTGKWDFRYPSVENFTVDNQRKPFAIDIQNTEACPRYAGITLTGVTVAPSPEWLQRKLRAIGIAPRNNVVDVTNFVLHELGQPLHAFDADKVQGSTIVVRTCPEGTPFVTLDGKERKLSAQDLMICSATEPLCIAGVLGGEQSGITDNTRSVFIESAYFNPVWVRKTARRHGISTDASFRFERGADPNVAVYALKRAAMLIKEVAGGEVSSDIVDSYPVPIQPAQVELSYSRITRLVGKDLGADTIKTILTALEFVILAETPDGLTVAVPTYRVDVLRECDVVEELLRIYSYNNIEIPSQVRASLSFVAKPDRERAVGKLSDFLTNRGFREIMSNSLTKAAYFEGNEAFDSRTLVRILNPLSGDLSVMRPTLLFSGLEAIAHNISYRNANLKLYELGNAYHFNPDKGGETLKAYSEEYYLSLFITGTTGTASWNSKPADMGFFHLKGTVEMLLERIGIQLGQLKEEPLVTPFTADGIRYSLPNGKPLAELGIVSKATRAQLDVKPDVYTATIRFGGIMEHLAKHAARYSELPKFPEVKRDLALVVDRSVTYSQLYQLSLKTERQLLRKLSLVDVYEGDKLPEGKKQYALSFTLRDDSKTLTDQQVEAIMSKLLKTFEKEAGAQLR